MLAELGARTFHDSFAEDNTAENINLYIKQSFSPEIQARELSEPRNIFLIAEVESIPVGYAQLLSNHRNEFITGGRTLELRRIYVLREQIGRGIGKELMTASVQEARQRGCASLWLGVWEKNQRAIEFYKRWGFREVGTHIFKLGNDPQRDLVMVLELH
jgi:ribosomal protein S18 acetylase RimI-like enzyme